MKTILLFTLLVLANFFYGQKDSVIEKKLYKNGKIKLVTYSRGTDTFEIRKYFKNGQIGDSIWLFTDGKNETAIGIEKSYFENGKLSSITFHGKDKEEYVTDTYREDGMLYSHVVKPTGVNYFYNKKGEVIKQFDENKFDDEVYVRKKYKHHKHLKGTSFASRIKYQSATLVDDKNKMQIKSGVLISLVLKTDTNVISHCQIEGYSSDSIYISKFDYNNLYDRVTDFEILKFERTYAIGINQLKTIIYSKHYNKRRSFRARTASIVGAELKIFPVLFGILLYKDLNVLAPYYAGTVAAGFIISYYSKVFYKSMIPKKYDMKKWKLKVQP
ncbi:MAG: hypothetical protein WCH21_10320 [Bacteroidota bacterium]